MRRSLLKTLTALSVCAAAAAISTPASAAVACGGYMDNFNPDAIDCNGFYDGNVLSGNPGDVTIQEAAVEDLLGVDIDPFLFTDYPKQSPLNGATTLDFGMALIGDVVIGIHFGNGSAVGNSTGFFLFHFDAPTTSVSWDIAASSAAVIYGGTPNNSVPEPATWAMMLLGFGATGFALRRRRQTAALAQIA